MKKSWIHCLKNGNSVAISLLSDLVTGDAYHAYHGNSPVEFFYYFSL